MDWEQQLSNPDADIRYMALNDFNVSLQALKAPPGNPQEQKFVTTIVKVLKDTNSQVQNISMNTQVQIHSL